MSQSNQRGWTLVATMITVLIMAILMIALFKGSSMFGGQAPSARKDGKGTTTMGAARYAAEDAVCQSNLNSVRQALAVAQTQDPDGKFPQSLQETHIGSEFYKCPLGGEPYVYDPVTGKVHCVHPGHESY